MVCVYMIRWAIIWAQPFVIPYIYYAASLLPQPPPLPSPFLTLPFLPRPILFTDQHLPPTRSTPVCRLSVPYLFHTTHVPIYTSFFFISVQTSTCRWLLPASTPVAPHRSCYVSHEHLLSCLPAITHVSP